MERKFTYVRYLLYFLFRGIVLWCRVSGGGIMRKALDLIIAMLPFLYGTTVYTLARLMTC